MRLRLRPDGSSCEDVQAFLKARLTTDFRNLDLGVGRVNLKAALLAATAEVLASPRMDFDVIALIDVGGNQGKFTELLAKSFGATASRGPTIHTYEVMSVYKISYNRTDFANTVVQNDILKYICKYNQRRSLSWGR
jgi:hypothetical protein